MKRLLPWLPITIMLSLVSCAKLGIGNPKPDKPSPNTQSNPFGPTGIPPALRSKGGDQGTPVTPGGNATAPLNFTPEEDIVFIDPDNPDASLPELSAILAKAPKRSNPWEESETIAKQRAAREGKPLLIWFTDSKNSPMCKALSQDLLSTPDFEKWALEKLVRLRIDANVASSSFVTDKDISLSDKESRMVDVRSYATRLKKQYKVLGYPALVMLNPSGEVIGHYRGYRRGQGDYTWGLLKQAEAVSANAYQSWRAGLEKKGYREWKDRKDRKVMAKLVRYSNGTPILIEPDGTRCRTEESKLCDSDRAWIAEQKKLRNIQ
ncbi:MAG: thioredoxin fold domain-containing protein [Verrucomicrobiota bacterium]